LKKRCGQCWHHAAAKLVSWPSSSSCRSSWRSSHRQAPTPCGTIHRLRCPPAGHHGGAVERHSRHMTTRCHHLHSQDSAHRLATCRRSRSVRCIMGKALHCKQTTTRQLTPAPCLCWCTSRGKRYGTTGDSAAGRAPAQHSTSTAQHTRLAMTTPPA
jgi:hypothetical protein